MRSSSADGVTRRPIAPTGDEQPGELKDTRASLQGGSLLPFQPGLAMAEVDALIAKVAPTGFSVLLRGETGVGKGVVAQRIHEMSTRAGIPLMQVNCAALSVDLFESEIFGHERGAFTHATQTKQGLLEVAAGGTVFLDEIGEMPSDVQAKLLLAIESRAIRRVGATQHRPIDVRFIFATHRNLETELGEGEFRADFYHRINDLTIHVPPLRERRDEIEGLSLQFARDAAVSLQRDRPPVFDDGARATLYHHDWPGNIRELRKVVRRAVLLSDENIMTSHLLVAAGLPPGVLSRTSGSHEAEERDLLIAVLSECGWNQSRAAKALGIARNTLIRRMEKYDIKRPRANGSRRTTAGW